MKNGACYIDDALKTECFRQALFPEGQINKDSVGQPIAQVAKLVILKPGNRGRADYLNREKMCCVMTAYEYGAWEEAVEIARQNLLYEGAGHSVDVQSNTQEHIEYAGLHLPVSRILVNQ
ncbi:MAG: hypothetical protein LBT68_04440, partial [Spirochaetales bacterium]|nr:hypothetical protein [Spirochaetales bacterium]